MPIERPSLSYVRGRGIRDHSERIEEFGADGTRFTSKLWVDYQERYDAALHYVGDVRIARDSAGVPTGLERLTPIQHPTVSTAYANKIRFQPWKVIGKTTTPGSGSGGSVVEGDYARADAEVEYLPVRYPVLEDDEVDEDTEWERFFYLSDTNQSVEYTTLPTGSMAYRSEDGLAPNVLTIPFNTGFILPITRLVYTWVNLPLDLLTNGDPWVKRMMGYVRPVEEGESGPPTRVRPFVGTTNANPWPGPNGFDPGTLLFESWRPIPRMSATGEPCWDIEFTVSHRPVPWNFCYYTNLTDPSRNGWYLALRDKSVTYPELGSIPDGMALFDEREFDYLTRVTPDPVLGS